MNFKFPILLAIAILPALACSRLGFFPHLHLCLCRQIWRPRLCLTAASQANLRQPVLEFIPVQITSPQESLSADCHVAGFRLLFRPTVVLSGGRAEYRIQTDPGETCTLQYTAPDGVLTQAQGTGAIIADSQGICKWTWELGELEGDGLVTVTIDQITQDFSIEVR
jgi:hypothetical protein